MANAEIITVPSNRPLPRPHEGLKHQMGVREGIAGTRPDVVSLCLLNSAGTYSWQKWFDGDGKLYVGVLAALPVARAEWHNTLVMIPGPPDNLYVCMQATVGTYFWRQILSGDGGSLRTTVTGI